jgi:hypothetical protein
MTAEQSSEIWAFGNLWKQSNNLIDLQTNGRVYSDFITQGMQDACDLESPPIGSGISSTVTCSEQARMILTKVLLGMTDEAAASTYNSINCSADSSDINIWMLALRCAYVFDGDTIAADTLKKYAYNPCNPGASMDYLTQTAVVNLVNAEILMNNYEGAIRAIDSILYREAPEEVKRKFLAYRAEVMYSDAGDTSYASVIDSMLSIYPYDNDIKNAKYMISFDTMTVLSFNKRTKEEHRPITSNQQEISAYPSPARHTQTIEMYSDNTIVNIEIYDFFGRKVSSSFYRYSVNAGVVNLHFNLPTGHYYIRIYMKHGFKISRLIVKGE